MANQFKNEQSIRAAAHKMAASAEERTSNNKIVFEELMEEVNKINPEMGGFEELTALLALPDEQFSLIAPVFLDELAKSFNNTNDMLTMAQAMNVSEVTVDEMLDQYNAIIAQIDVALKDESAVKRNFLKQMLGLTYNAIAEVEGVARRIIEVPIEFCSEGAKMPLYATLGSAAVDLYSPEEITINPGEIKIVKTGIKVALPPGYALLIHPRSGLSAKSHLRVANSIGLIDSDYRDEIGVILENTDAPIRELEVDADGKVKSISYGQAYTIGKGERFAQMRLVAAPKMNFYEIENVKAIGDDRGGGFGSTGKE